MTGPSEDGFTVPEDAADLGHDHYLAYSGWAPDRELNPHRAHLPDVEKYGAVIYHKNPAGRPCAGFVTFAGPVQQEIDPDHATWDVISWEPLTISPSVLCSCGDHGFIQDGRWTPA
jgi:hypothetical protein